MTRSEIVAKQLAHNALNGMDDPQTLAQLYNEIADMESRITTGLTEQEVKAMVSDIKVDDLGLDIFYEILNIVFVERDFKRFKEIMDLVDKEATIYVADKEDFSRFVEQTKNVTQSFNIRNMAAIVAKMVDLLEEYFGVAPVGGNPDWFAANVGKRRGMVPPAVMKKFDEAMTAAEKVTGSNKFTPNFEAIVADFLSGSSQE